MYRGTKQKFDWSFALRVSDVLCVALAFPLALQLSHAILPGEWSSETRLPSPLACLTWGLLLLYAMDRLQMYTWTRFIRFGALLKSLPGPLLTGTVVFLVLRFLLAGESPLDLAPFLVLQFLCAFLLLTLGRIIVRFIDAWVLKAVMIERIAFVGWSPKLESVLLALVADMGRYQEVVGYFSETASDPDTPSSRHSYSCLGTVDKLDALVQERGISLLLVDQSRVTQDTLRQLADSSAKDMVGLRMIPSTFDILTSRINLRLIAGVPVMGINDLHHDRFGNRFAKRVLDIVCSLFGLLVSAPLIAVLAILIKRESPGPVFYRQTRLGLRGKPFQMVKLRSMHPDSEVVGQAGWTVKDDPRRLKIGTFMREWNLDELPQFWNVLKGEMSMVGPRPERPEFVKDFKNSIRYYNLRHTCKPGVTGWAAVHGLRGNTSLDDRVEYDLFYIENWSIMLDIRIMLMTLAPPKNAY